MAVELSVLERLVAARALYELVGFRVLEEQKLTATCTIYHLRSELNHVAN